MSYHVAIFDSGGLFDADSLNVGENVPRVACKMSHRVPVLASVFPFALVVGDDSGGRRSLTEVVYLVGGLPRRCMSGSGRAA